MGSQHGTNANYQQGCRCDECRAAHTRAANEHRKRRAYGRTSPNDRLPVEDTVADIAAMRAHGLTWRQIAKMAEVAEDTITATHNGRRKHVSLMVVKKVRAARATVEALGEQAVAQDAMLVDGSLTRWMIRSLHARGWSRDWLMGELGVQNFNVYQQARVFIWTQQTITDLFDAHAHTWGPARRTAVDAWRRGHFPADCYEWDQPIPDLRPIPGSLHPDLVREALSFVNADRDKRRVAVYRERLRDWGQFPNPSCARAVMLLWMERQGMDTDDFLSDGGVCGFPSHGHQLPAYWLDDDHPTRRKGLSEHVTG